VADALGIKQVSGLRELQQAAAQAGKAAQVEVQRALKTVGEPVRAAAESRAVEQISHIGDQWSQMRVGVTRKLIYVAPKQRGRQGRRNPALKRPNLALLLLERAMEPALDANRGRIEHDMESALERVADVFER
jgi:hypothetical protein